ncbi:MAG: RDD family protein [Prevotellaceae bacterium]|nr:RDD family protein [Prevotellaceae bacterium]
MTENKELTAGKRIGAMLLDHIVMTFVIMIIAMPAMISDMADTFSDKPIAPKGAIDWSLILMCFGMALYFNKDMIQGKSIAKRALKQEVVDIKTGEVASALKCFVRNLTMAIWPIEVIVVLISPARRIGDFIAGTRVELMTDDRNSKPKVDLKKVAISLSLGFIILFAGSFLFKDKLILGDITSNDPSYIPSSYNKDLSLQLENQLNTTQYQYLRNTDIKVYDNITNDSLKFIDASFDLKEDYIEDPSFEKIKTEIFKSMYEIIPKEKFILKGKFIYDGGNTKKWTVNTYDWRQIK